MSSGLSFSLERPRSPQLHKPYLFGLQYGQALKFPYSLPQTLKLFVRFDVRRIAHAPS